MYQNVGVDWNVFKYIFSTNPRKEFEQLAYLLFCFEFDQPFGVFRYFNQAHIETTPINFNDDCIGFQAKYYDDTTTLSSKNNELKSAISGAKRTYSNINRLIFYVNKEFAPSSKKDKEKPQYLIDIEKHGTSLGVSIEWRVCSQFEAMLNNPKLAIVRDYYFNPNKGINSYIALINSHSNSVFNNISSDIEFNGVSVKVNHTAFDTESFLCSGSHCLIVHGEGGSGKSGFVKDNFQAETSFPLFCFRATDFDVSSLSEFSRKFGEYTFDAFLNIFHDAPVKVCVIDSSEKFFTMMHQDTFVNALNLLIKDNWKLIVTIRSSYKDNFINSVLHTTKAVEHQINRLDVEDLATLGKKYSIGLPADSKLCDLICNLFYLRLYASTIDSSRKDTVASFKQRIWNEIICNTTNMRENLHVRREDAICNIVSSNINNGLYYYVRRSSDDSQAIEALLASEIIAIDRTMNGYYLTHDVYEEIVLKHLIQIAYNRKSILDDFFSSIGNTLTMRKALRYWLHESFEFNQADLQNFVTDVLKSGTVEGIWKDEILIAILGDTTQIFQNVLERLLGENNYELLFRAISILNTTSRIVNVQFWQQILTTKELESHNIYRCTIPSGLGWGVLIEYIYKQKTQINWDAISVMLTAEILNAWVGSNPKGLATRNAGQTALYLYDIVNASGELRYRLNDEKTKKIISTILLSAEEISAELMVIFDKIIEERMTSHQSPHHDLCLQLLSDNTDSYSMCVVAPDTVIALAKCFWLKQNDEHDIWHSSIDMDGYFGLSGKGYDYHPTSALQTPMFSLLQASPIKAIDFIIDLFNHAAEAYRDSRLDKDYDECSDIQIFISNEKTHNQIASSRLWHIYRDTSFAPELLECILMALERWLYLGMPSLSKDVAVSLCKRLLYKSNSAAITAVVVSIVTAYPNKLFEVACILLHTKEIFIYDIHRLLKERESSYFRGFMPRDEIFDNERISSNKFPFRQKRFEDVIREYQLNNGDLTDEEFQQRLDVLYCNMDESFKNLDSLDSSFQFSYYRMDVRKMEPRIEEAEEHDGNTYIPFTATLPDTLLEEQKATREYNDEVFKHTPLFLWSRSRYEKDNEDYAKYNQYEESPSSALKEALEIGCDKQDAFLDRSIAIYVAAVLLRDFCNTLSQVEIDSCASILIGRLETYVCSNTSWQGADGLDAAIATLPILISKQENVSDNSLRNPIALLLAMLLDWDKPREWATYAFRKGIYTKNCVIANTIITAFCRLKPVYDQRVLNRNGISREKFMQSYFEDAYIHDAAGTNPDYSSLGYEALQTLSMLTDSSIPSSTGIVVDAGKHLWPVMFSNKRERRETNRNLDYGHEYNYITWLGEYLLCSSEGSQNLVMQNLIPYIKAPDNLEKLLCKIIFCQDEKKNNSAFWRLWNKFFAAIEEYYEPYRDSIAKDRHHHEYLIHKSEELIITYALAHQWDKKRKSWHTLNIKNSNFFERLANNLGYHPCIIYSISRVLNTIGYEQLLDYGIDWLLKIINDNDHLIKVALPINTEFYIEEYMQRYIHKHKNKIKSNSEMRKAVISILSFLVERGSTCGYMLRENLS